MSFAVNGFMDGPESLDDVDIPGFPSSAKPEGFTANLQVSTSRDTYVPIYREGIHTSSTRSGNQNPRWSHKLCTPLCLHIVFG